MWSPVAQNAPGSTVRPILMRCALPGGWIYLDRDISVQTRSPFPLSLSPSPQSFYLFSWPENLSELERNWSPQLYLSVLITCLLPCSTLFMSFKSCMNYCLSLRQVSVPGEAGVSWYLPAHVMLQLSGLETPILSLLPTDLCPLRPHLPAPLWEVCSQPPGRAPPSPPPPHLPPQPTGELQACQVANGLILPRILTVW